MTSEYDDKQQDTRGRLDKLYCLMSSINYSYF